MPNFLSIYAGFLDYFSEISQGNSLFYNACLNASVHYAQSSSSYALLLGNPARLTARLARLAIASNRTNVLQAYLKTQNAVLDEEYYDSEALSDAELAYLLDHVAMEGSLIVVRPEASSDTALNLSVYQDVETLLEKEDGQKIQILSMSGVGSSAFGAAALARNVANAFDRPVVSVVAGYGVADVTKEALGGFYWYGAINRLEADIHRALTSGAPLLPLFQAVLDLYQPARTAIFAAGDSAQVRALLTSKGLQINLMVGHSKGNLVNAQALFDLKGQNNHDYPALIDRKLHVITISAAVAMPDDVPYVYDILGACDPLGALNSTPGITINQFVPAASHTTNRLLSDAIPVQAVLQALSPGFYP